MNKREFIEECAMRNIAAMFTRMYTNDCWSATVDEYDKTDFAICLSNTKSLKDNFKISSFLFVYPITITTDNPSAMIVARAAPITPIFSPITNNKSKIALIAIAITKKISGVNELPIERIA